MDPLKKKFPQVLEEDLETALRYAEGEVDLAMAMVGSALEFTITPQRGKVRVLGNVDAIKGEKPGNSGGAGGVPGERKRRPYSFTRTISEPITSTKVSGSAKQTGSSSYNKSSTSLPQTKTAISPPGANDPSPSKTDEETIECQCCFDNFSVDEITCCSAAGPHLFCFPCAKRYAEGEIGKTKFELVCLDGSGCGAPFEESEIRRFLDDKAFKLLDKLRTANVLKEADIEGLVHCPFCSFAAIMEDPTDKIFHCEGCGVKSCRYCRVKSHHPLSCEKFNKEKHLDAKHQVEEAMTQALVRKCNNCKKPFLKEGGCNKMRCSCGNTQCFLCSANVQDYTHFDRRDRHGRKVGCTLYGDTRDVLKKEVKEAQEKAVKEIMERRGDVKEEDVLVDKEVEVPKNIDGPGPPPGIMMGGQGPFGVLPMPNMPMMAQVPPFVIPGAGQFGLEGLQQQFMNLGNPFPQRANGHAQNQNPFLNHPLGMFGPQDIPYADPFRPWVNNPVRQVPLRPVQQPDRRGHGPWNQNWPLPAARVNERPVPPPVQLQPPPRPANQNNIHARTQQEVPTGPRSARHPGPPNPRTPQNRNNGNAAAPPPPPPNTPHNHPPTPNGAGIPRAPRADLAAERRAPRTPTWLQGVNQNPLGQPLVNPYNLFGEWANNNGNGRDVNGPRTAPLRNTGRRMAEDELGDQM